MSTNKYVFMDLLKQLSNVYDGYDRGRLKYLDAEHRGRKILGQLRALLQEPTVRGALFSLQSSSTNAGLPAPGDSESFISVELGVTEGFGFTRASLKTLLAEAKRSTGAALPTAHPADALDSILTTSHEQQMSALMAAKELGGRKRKKSKKKVIRKGVAKVSGGAAIVIADALGMPAVWAQNSFFAGVASMVSGLDDLAG